MDHEYRVPSCVRGHHVYKNTWSPILGDTLLCERETNNNRDRYAVAVLKQRIVVGHLPEKISKLCSLFLRREGAVEVVVIGHRRYSRNLPQGGLEVPCDVIFKSSDKKEVDKVKKYMKD